MRPTGPAGVAARRRRVAAGGAVQPLQASSVCGVMARQGRCVAKAGVRNAAARAASKHAEAWVCPPASCFLPPFRSASLSPAPLPLPGVRSSARRLGEARRAGRPMENVDVGCGAPGGVSVESVWRRRAGRRCRSPLSTPQAPGALCGETAPSRSTSERRIDRTIGLPLYSGTCLMETVRRGHHARRLSFGDGPAGQRTPPRPGAVGGSGRRCSWTVSRLCDRRVAPGGRRAVPGRTFALS